MNSKQLLLLVFFILVGCKEKQENMANQSIDPRVLHEKVWTIDTHVDTPLDLVRRNVDMGVRGDIDDGANQLDFIRMKEGGLDAVFFAAFVAQGSRDADGYQRAQNKVETAIDATLKAVKKYPDLAGMTYSADDLNDLNQDGQRSILLGIENGYPIGTDISKVQYFYDRGVRYITLCHTANNDICDSSTDSTEHNGLSEFGKEVVNEMNRLGMIVDVSHISDKAFYDVLEESSAPVIASHSCARAIRNHPRNLDDDMLRALAKNGGVVQMCILSYYVKVVKQTAERDSVNAALKKKWGSYDDRTEEQKKLARIDFAQLDKDHPEILATVSDAVDHIDHMVKIAGIDHVGIGTDFDGGGGLADCRDVSELPNITAELVKRGYSAEEIANIWGGNFMRVLKAVEEKAGK